MQNNSMKKNVADAMKLGMRRLAAGVCILSTQIPSDQRFAMTVSSVTSVSDSPASLLVCVNKMVSQQEYLTKQGSVFAVNVLSQHHQELSDVCAGRYPGRNRFELGNWVEVAGVPTLADAPAVFICKTDQVASYGTHKIIIGAISQVILQESELNPLLYVDGSYGSFTRKI
jgi:flavin reductase (DIM6/NTAB) family NADH-FMN oxidoreductase RutF